MKPLNFAVIGAGNIGKVHALALSHVPEARVAVICNRTEATGRPLAEKYGADWVADYETAVTRPDVDVVAIGTPNSTHAEIGIAAARAGKHLLVEKPLDVTLSRIDRLIAAAQQAGVKLACIFPLRFAAGASQAKAAIEAGRLGRLTMADVHVKWYRPQTYYDQNWRGTWGSDGGGALINQAIHNIDLMQWLVGPVASVFGHTATLAHDMETEDTASAVLTFQNGALGVIQGATSCWPGDPARVELHGDKGTIILEEGRIVGWKLSDARPGEVEEILGVTDQQGSGASDPTAIGFEMHRRQIVDLIEAIRDDRPPAIVGAEGRKAVEIIRAIYHSARSGQVIKLPFLDN